MLHLKQPICKQRNVKHAGRMPIQAVGACEDQRYLRFFALDTATPPGLTDPIVDWRQCCSDECYCERWLDN